MPPDIPDEQRAVLSRGLAGTDRNHPSSVSRAKAVDRGLESDHSVAQDRKPSGTRAPVGFGDVKLAEARAFDASRAKLKNFADRLLSVAVKADTLRQTTTQDPNLASQQHTLDTHVERVTDWLIDELSAGGVNVTAARSIDVGIEAGGLTADLMHLDRIGVATKTRVRRPINRGLDWMWHVMDSLATDPAWATTHRSEANRALGAADAHRETVAELMPFVGALRAGATAAMIVDFAVSVPRLLASGSSLLKGLAEWISRGGGSGGALSMATVGGGTVLILTSGGRSVVLSTEQIEALVSAGILSEETVTIYNMSMAAGGGGPAAGPHGARPPGSKSRYSDEELAKDYLKEIGQRLPTGERAAQEMGVLARSLRKVDEYHHLLVRQLQRWFKSRGVDINEFTVKLTADEHRWIHNEYRWNDLWKAFRLKNPKASPEEILAAMKEFQRKVGIEGLEIVPYPR